MRTAHDITTRVELQRAALEERLLLVTEVIAARCGDDTLPYPDLARTVRDILAEPLA